MGLSRRPGLAVRQAAARLLAAIIDRQVSADGLTDDIGGNPHYLALSPQDRALVRAILMPALRHRNALQALVDGQLDRPLPQNAHALGHILHVALAQMLYLDVPARAAVDLAVEHARGDPRTRRFSGLVNALLRGILRLPEEQRQRIVTETRQLPEWLAERIDAAYGPEKAAAIGAALRVPAPIDFTVKAEPGRWAKIFGGIVLPTGTVRVERPAVPIAELPSYAEGRWWVQDAASALPARLFGDLRGSRIADLCAAPGGKTAQLAHAGAAVTAVEASSSRMKRLRSNLERLRLDAELVHADLFAYSPSTPFDAVLLDAPCSSTGTIRRHPDIAWTKTPADVEKLAALQWRMLCQAFQFLKPGGVLVFSNCSLDPSEGEALARRFAGEIPDMLPLPVAPSELPGADHLITAEGYLRTTPADFPLDRPELSGMDGFFAARFQRKA